MSIYWPSWKDYSVNVFRNHMIKLCDQNFFYRMTSCPTCTLIWYLKAHHTRSPFYVTNCQPMKANLYFMKKDNNGLNPYHSKQIYTQGQWFLNFLPNQALAVEPEISFTGESWTTDFHLGVVCLEWRNWCSESYLWYVSYWAKPDIACLAYLICLCPICL